MARAHRQLALFVRVSESILRSSYTQRSQKISALLYVLRLYATEASNTLCLSLFFVSAGVKTAEQVLCKPVGHFCSLKSLHLPRILCPT